MCAATGVPSSVLVLVLVRVLALVLVLVLVLVHVLVLVLVRRPNIVPNRIELLAMRRI